MKEWYTVFCFDRQCQTISCCTETVDMLEMMKPGLLYPCTCTKIVQNLAVSFNSIWDWMANLH